MQLCIYQYLILFDDTNDGHINLISSVVNWLVSNFLAPLFFSRSLSFSHSVTNNEKFLDQHCKYYKITYSEIAVMYYWNIVSKIMY